MDFEKKRWEKEDNDEENLFERLQDLRQRSLFRDTKSQTHTDNNNNRYIHTHTYIYIYITTNNKLGQKKKM